MLAKRTMSCNFSGPGFWILAKGGIGQPVLGLPCPNSIKVVGIQQPTVPAHMNTCKLVHLQEGEMSGLGSDKDIHVGRAEVLQVRGQNWIGEFFGYRGRVEEVEA